MEVLSFIIGIIGTLLSTFGIFLTIKSNRAMKSSKTITWDQLLSASKFLCCKLKREGFIPEIIICPGQKGGIISQLIIDDLDIEIPIYTGFLISKENPIQESLKKNYILLNTSKWNVFLPKSLETSFEKKTLIVDDFVMSGDFLSTIKTKLKALGYSENNLKSCCVATTDVAIQTKKAPSLYWKIIDAKDSYFPWGKVK